MNMIEIIKKINNKFIEIADSGNSISDLDECELYFEDDSVKSCMEFRELLDGAKKEDIIRTSITNGRGISITSWFWTHNTYMISFKNNIKLIDPEF